MYFVCGRVQNEKEKNLPSVCTTKAGGLFVVYVSTLNVPDFTR